MKAYIHANKLIFMPLEDKSKSSYSNTTRKENYCYCKTIFSTFFCFCGTIGLPLGICFNFCTSVNGDFFSSEASLFQEVGFGENRTFALGVLFWFSFSLPLFLSDLGPFVSTCV